MDDPALERLYATRRDRLRQLIDERSGGVIAVFAERTGINASYVARMLYPAGKKGGKNIGDVQIAKIRSTYTDVPAGWFDTPFDASPSRRLRAVVDVEATPDALQLARRIARLDPAARRIVESVVREFEDRPSNGSGRKTNRA